MSDTKLTLGPLQTKWIESLEAHPERQGKLSLGKKNDDGTYKACCLGEGGLIAGVCEWGSDGWLRTVTWPKSNTSLADNTYEALGLRGPDGETPSGSEECLSMLNDKGTTWPEIAVLLRENPDRYFVKSV